MPVVAKCSFHRKYRVFAVGESIVVHVFCGAVRALAAGGFAIVVFTSIAGTSLRIP